MIFTNFISGPPTPEESERVSQVSDSCVSSFNFFESATNKLRHLIQASAQVKFKEGDPPESRRKLDDVDDDDDDEGLQVSGTGIEEATQEEDRRITSQQRSVKQPPQQQQHTGDRRHPQELKLKQKDWQLERKYTLSEVQQHSSLDDCWMVIFDKVYDITQFVDEHPGGDFILLEYAGRDATHPFLSSRHGSSAYKMLDKYWIGILVDEELYYSNNSSYCSVYSNLSWRSTPTLEETSPSTQLELTPSTQQTAPTISRGVEQPLGSEWSAAIF